ncbi:MAG TPA: signal peptidase I [Acidimicrobiia bacterium]|nr:signal peptidase I [Acidimicrobiia bacterium]
MPRAARPALRLVAVLAAVAWALLLRPLGLGGPATYVVVSGESMLPNLQGGDLVITHQRRSYEPGDVVAFRVKGKLVIHRVMGGNGVDGYVTRGDNNPAPDPWRPTNADIAGESRFVVPGGGRPIGRLRQDPALLACLAGGVALSLMLSRRGRAEEPTRGADRLAEESAR